MGYAIRTYAVDEYRVKAFWRSNDTGVIEQVLASPLGEFRLRDMPKVRDALAEMANGTSPNGAAGIQADGAHYLYATELLLRTTE